MRPPRENPMPGQESVWDYPRPPRIEPCAFHIRVVFANELVAETRRALRLLEMSHPPSYYVPAEDVQLRILRPSAKRSFCEFKGMASYWDVVCGARTSPSAAWSYASPTSGFAELKEHFAFYPSRVDGCFVNGELVTPQGGGFYGGWITSHVVGPFKGDPGTEGW